MMHLNGCEGSTSLQTVARELMSAHGNPPARTEFEPFNPRQKSFIGKRFSNYNISLPAKAMLFLHGSSRQGRPVVFKSSSMFALSGVAAAVSASGTLAVAIWRSNVLDQHVCKIKDCFVPRNVGFSVDEGGQRLDDCMKRRTDNKKLLAFVNPDVLLNRLNALGSLGEKRLRELNSNGFKKTDLLSTEQLLDFEWTDKAEDLESAVDGWSRLLKAWGMTPNGNTIRDYLRKLCGSRKQMAHKRIIYNLKDVEKVLSGTRFSSMLRHEDSVPSKSECKCCK